MSDYLVTVCDKCFRASCWHGEFMCQDAQSAGTVDMESKALDRLGLEHPNNYSRQKLMDVCGDVQEIA